MSRYAPAAAPGMPGPYPGRVVSVTSAKSVDTATGAANAEVVREMMARGMRALTGETEQAIAHLRRAIELDPRFAELAKNDSDFDGIREQVTPLTG